MPAAGLADFGTGHPHPLVFGGGVEHAAQQLAVASLELGLLLKRLAGRGNPVRKRVAHPLQLPKACDPRLAARDRYAGINLDPRECLHHEVSELALQAADLAAQLGASEALVAPHSKRDRCVSFEQIRHN